MYAGEKLRSPLTRLASLADLSPQAGRGEGENYSAARNSDFTSSSSAFTLLLSRRAMSS